MLERTEADLQALLEYLFTRGYAVKRFSVRYAPRKDRDNDGDPRAFCDIRRGDRYVSCTQYLDDVGPHVRVGILLHEFGHMYLDAFKGDECEVKVDEWIIKTFPEAGYTYGDHLYFKGEQPRIARNVQHVSPAFLKRLGYE